MRPSVSEVEDFFAFERHLAIIPSLADASEEINNTARNLFDMDEKPLISFALLEGETTEQALVRMQTAFSYDAHGQPTFNGHAVRDIDKHSVEKLHFFLRDSTLHQQGLQDLMAERDAKSRGQIHISVPLVKAITDVNTPEQAERAVYYLMHAITEGSPKHVQPDSYESCCSMNLCKEMTTWSWPSSMPHNKLKRRPCVHASEI